MRGRRSFPCAVAALALCFAAPARLVAQPTPAATGAARLAAMNVAFEPERFVQFAGQGDTAIVEAFLEAGMPPDSPEPRRGSTALIHAAANGHARMVARLLEAGASPRLADRDGTTALTAACYFAKPDVVEALLAKGADARAVPGNAGVSALEAAIWGGSARIVKLLLAAGADGVGATREVPPLVRAAYTGRPDILGLLLDSGPPPAVVRVARDAARRARHAEAEALLSKALGP